VRRAAILLQSDHTSIDQVAHNTGYASRSGFLRNALVTRDIDILPHDQLSNCPPSRDRLHSNEFIDKRVTARRENSCNNEGKDDRRRGRQLGRQADLQSRRAASKFSALLKSNGCAGAATDCQAFAVRLSRVCLKQWSSIVS
jgi:hypothetical protein